MRAVRYRRGEPGVVLRDVPVGRPGPDEVLVRVTAAGVCGTDVRIAFGGATRMVSRQEITLGHETAGTVAELGTAVTGWAVGDTVVVAPIVACGHCRHCVAGSGQLCDDSTVFGLGRDGAFAEYVVAPATTLVRLPAGIPPSIGAILTDAVATPYHALVDRARLLPGESVAIFGVGGLGQHAVQLARLAGAARIVAVDVRPGQLDLALENGADAVVDARVDDVPTAVRRANDGRGVDVAGEFVGRARSIESAFASITKGGRLVVVGLGDEPVTLPPSGMFAMREVALLGSGGYGTDTIERLVSLVASGRLSLGSSVSHTVGLDDVGKALLMLRDRTASVRRVVAVP